MKKAVRAADVVALITEIQRYLAFLDALRAVSNRPPSGRGGGRSGR